MLISVIIPTYHRNDLLLKCLECLGPGRQVGLEINGHGEELVSKATFGYEVVVTDDGSVSTAKDLIQGNFPWARWVAGPRRGPAANRNNGASHAAGDWLVFIDDDCLPEPKLLLSYSEEIKKGGSKALEGSTEADRPQRRFDEVAPINISGGNFWSCNIAIEVDTFRKIDGFDEGFPFAALEDVDFYMRVKEVTEVPFVPGAKVIHPWRRMRPFEGYRKWLVSNKYFFEKYSIKRDKAFRLNRTKFLIGSCVMDFQKLMSFSFAGGLYYLESVWFHFRMIFI